MRQWPRRAAHRGREARPGAGPDSLSSDGRPAARQGMRTPHRSAELSVDASSLAVSCGSRGVSLDIGPASLFSAPETPQCRPSQGSDGERSPSARSLAPQPGSAQCRIDSGSDRRRSTAVPRSRWHRPRPRATVNVASGALRCVDRHAAASAARHLGVTGRPVTPSCRAPGPAMSPKGDEVMPGMIAAHHHASTTFLLSGLFAAAGPNAALAPRHYRTPPPPRRAPAEVVTGRNTWSIARRHAYWARAHEPREVTLIREGSARLDAKDRVEVPRPAAIAH